MRNNCQQFHFRSHLCSIFFSLFFICLWLWQSFPHSYCLTVFAFVMTNYGKSALCVICFFVVVVVVKPSSFRFHMIFLTYQCDESNRDDDGILWTNEPHYYYAIHSIYAFVFSFYLQCALPCCRVAIALTNLLRILQLARYV